MLKNRMYVGDINHRGASYKGEHAAIVDAALFEAVQVKLAAQRCTRDRRKGKSDALLTGRLFDSRGNIMSPQPHAEEGRALPLLRVSAAIVQGRKAEAGAVARVPASRHRASRSRRPRAIVIATAASCDDAVAVRGALDSVDLRVVLRSENAELSWVELEPYGRGDR